MSRLQAKKLADVIAEQLEGMLIDGQLLPGHRLPSERELAAQFDVSRPSLREAIQMLESKGLLYRKQGGGTYVNDQLTPKVTDPLMELIASRPEGQFDLLEFRHALEGMAAYYAALRGSVADVEALQLTFEQVKKETLSDSLVNLAQTLVDFYMCMAKGSHNFVLIQVLGSLMPLLKDNILANLQMLKTVPDAYAKIHAQREKVVAAIVAKNPEQARSASNEQLEFIERTLLEINRQDSRMQRALRRIEIN